MKRNSLIIPFTALALLPTLWSCKPTEANYRSAYEAAKSGRNSTNNDLEMQGIIREGDPTWVRVGNDSVLYLTQPLMPLEGDSLPLKPCNVAVAVYGMRTNAISHAERLKAQGYESRVLKTKEGKFITIAAQTDSLPHTLPIIKEYVRRHPSDIYTGLPGRPVVEAPSASQLR